MIEIKFFEIDGSDDVFAAALDVYQTCGFLDEDDNLEMILNSAYCGVVYLDDIPVGVGRVISDDIRYSLICDLNIIKKYQNKGCGKALAIALAEKAKTNRVFLTTDPKDPGLKEFYQKAGFKLSEGESVFKWPKNNKI